MSSSTRSLLPAFPHIRTESVRISPCHTRVESPCYHVVTIITEEVSPMKNATDERTALFLKVYDALTPENRARLFALLEELAQSQGVSFDSRPKETQKS